LIQVTELNAEIMMQLSERIAQGEWLAIAADRVPVRGEKTVVAPFLGELAHWPQGPWLMAGLLKVPVNTLFCIKQAGQYHLYLKRFKQHITWTRSNREASMAKCASDYAQVLQSHCVKTPWQWFNFYDFWNQHDKRDSGIAP
jgi:predicted LPLAT superfamily acyltransferase